MNEEDGFELSDSLPLAQEESVFQSEEKRKPQPRETFLGRAYHSNAAVEQIGDNIEPEPITDYSQEIASELVSADKYSYTESAAYCNYYEGVMANEDRSDNQE